MNEQKLIQLIPALRGRSANVSPLGGGLTNRNYRIDIGPESYVLRIAGKDTALLGIDRACEAACSRAAAELGIGPELVAYLPEHGLVFRQIRHQLRPRSWESDRSWWRICRNTRPCSGVSCQVVCSRPRIFDNPPSCAAWWKRFAV